MSPYPTVEIVTILKYIASIESSEREKLFRNTANNVAYASAHWNKEERFSLNERKGWAGYRLMNVAYVLSSTTSYSRYALTTANPARKDNASLFTVNHTATTRAIARNA